MCNCAVARSIEYAAHARSTMNHYYYILPLNDMYGKCNNAKALEISLPLICK